MRTFPYEALLMFGLALWYATCGYLELSVIMAAIAGRWVREWKRS